MLRFSLLILMTFVAQICVAAPLPESDQLAVMKTVEAFNSATLSKDYSAVVALMFEPVVKMAGGREQLIEDLSQVDKTSLAAHLEVVSVKNTAPSELIDAGDSEICFVPTVIVMRMKATAVRDTSFNVAVRRKGNSDWKLINGSGLRKHPEMIETLLPGLAKDVKFPVNVLEKLDATTLNSTTTKTGAEKVAANISKAARFPMRVDEYTQFVSVTGAGDTVSFNYRVVETTHLEDISDDLPDELTKSAKLKACAGPSFIRILQEGYKIAVNYSIGVEEKNVRVDIKPGDCQAAH